MMKTTKNICLGLVLMAGLGFAQEVAENEKKVALEEFEIPPSWDVTCEVFSLPLSEAAKLKKTSRKLEITPAVSALRRGSVTVGGRARRR